MARKESAKAKIEKQPEPLPLFECLFCSQEHFVLNKFSEQLIQVNCFPMHTVAHNIVTQATRKMDDYQNPFTVFKVLA